MPNEYSDAERLAKLETEIEGLKMIILRIEAKFDASQSNFVSKDMLEDKLRLRDERIERLEQEKSTNKNTAPLWATAIFAGIAIVISLWTHVG